jgi:hypothetical protein
MRQAARRRGLVHVGRTGVPPGPRPFAALTRTRSTSALWHGYARSRLLPLPPQHAAEPPPHPLIELVQYGFGLHSAGSNRSDPQQRIERRDRALQRPTASGSQPLSHLLLQSLYACRRTAKAALRCTVHVYPYRALHLLACSPRGSRLDSFPLRRASVLLPASFGPRVAPRTLTFR